MEVPFTPPFAPDGNHYMVPSGIRPVLQKTRIEVLFYLLSTSLIPLPPPQVLCWGVRNMKRYNLLQVTSPLVELECGGHTLRTKHIPNANKNPNFPDPVVSMDVVRVEGWGVEHEY